jgi:hypothetical protein
MEDAMTDLKSRADELIDSAIDDARAEMFNPNKYTSEQAKESYAALTRFVHALCECAGGVRELLDEQNGPPLINRAARYHNAYDRVLAALAEVEKVGE